MQFTCKYEKTLSRRDDTGETICLLLPDEKLEDFNKRCIKAKGVMNLYTPGTPLVVEGEFDDEQTKKLFWIDWIRPNVDSKEQLIQYIRSCLPYGAGEKTAEKIFLKMKEKGQDMETFLSDDPTGDLIHIKLLDEGKIAHFVRKAGKDLEIYKVFTLYAKHGLTHSDAVNLVQQYGSLTLSKIRENPYTALTSCGISFYIADAIAKDLKFPYNHVSRVRSMINLCLYKIIESGNSYESYKSFIKRIRYFEKTSTAFIEEQVPEGILMMELDYTKKSYCKSKNTLRIYPSEIIKAEQYIASRVLGMSKWNEPFLSETLLDSILEKDDMLDEDQKNAVKGICCSTEPSILIGNPGTGKTTTIKKIAELFTTYRPDWEIALAAPTGRAAERIHESCNMEATTIHVLLEYVNIYGVDIMPKRNEFQPLDADIVIIDEMSMVGIFLFQNLLKALKPGAKLILVGDWNQLPSIEPGTLLYDLHHVLKTYELKTVHRQAADGRSIIDNAQKLRKGDNQFILDDHFQIWNFDNEKDAQRACVLEYTRIHDIEDLNKVHILAQERNGMLGVNALNLEIQKCSFTDHDEYFQYKTERFYIGDKVMTLRNRYDENCRYFNGDIWKVSGLAKDGVYLSRDDRDEIFVSLDNMDDLTLSYSMTVHKSQGSEGEYIFIMLSSETSSSMIYGALLYTAITRAKRKVILFNVKNTLYRYQTAKFLQEKKSSLLEYLLKDNN